MIPAAPRELTIHQRRRARRLACTNAGLWALGNGLGSSWMILFFAMDLGARQIGLTLSMIRAAPHLAGLLRLAAPALIARLGGRKRFCAGAYLLSTVVLLALPLLAAPGWLPSAGRAIAVLVVLWCVYHLLEYLAGVALWSWLADMAPQRVRGRFLGRRERWLVSGQLLGMLAAAGFNWWWSRLLPASRSAQWLGYAIPLGTGALLMATAVIPLWRMPALSGSAPRTGPGLRALLAPLADSRFLRLLAFGCWFSFFNGLTLPVQDSYLKLLGLTVAVPLVLTVVMRLGQFTLSPWIGRAADRLGNLPVLGASLILVAAAPLFYYFASLERPWWIVGAWVFWIAYVGINVGLPNLMLKLSPRQGNASYIATYYAVTGLCLAGSTVFGGALLDGLRNLQFHLPGLGPQDYYHTAFLFSWIARSLGLVLLVLVIEPRKIA